MRFHSDDPWLTEIVRDLFLEGTHWRFITESGDLCYMKILWQEYPRICYRVYRVRDDRYQGPFERSITTTPWIKTWFEKVTEEELLCDILSQ